MIKNQTLIVLCLLMTPCFCIGKESLLGHRISYHYESNLKNQKLILHSLPTWTLQNCLNTYNSDVLVRGLGDGKNPFWKQAGIYSLEFLGGGIGTCLSAKLGLTIWEHIAGAFIIDPAGIKGFMIGSGVYVISNSLLASGSTFLVGKLLNQKGSWGKAAVGAGIGSLLNIITFVTCYSSPALFLSSFSLPPLGAVIGFNL